MSGEESLDLKAFNPMTSPTDLSPDILFTLTFRFLSMRLVEGERLDGGCCFDKARFGTYALSLGNVYWDIAKGTIPD